MESNDDLVVAESDVDRVAVVDSLRVSQYTKVFITQSPSVWPLTR